MQREPPFPVHITEDAAERIRSRGGRLFLWQRPVGRSYLRDCLSMTSPPTDIDFDCYHQSRRDVHVCIPSDLEVREIIVRARRWPFSGVRIYVDGGRWGWRGVGVTSAAG